jgi:hypothetical protein
MNDSALKAGNKDARRLNCGDFLFRLCRMAHRESEPQRFFLSPKHYPLSSTRFADSAVFHDSPRPAVPLFGI